MKKYPGPEEPQRTTRGLPTFGQQSISLALQPRERRRALSFSPLLSFLGEVRKKTTVDEWTRRKMKYGQTKYFTEQNSSIEKKKKKKNVGY